MMIKHLPCKESVFRNLNYKIELYLPCYLLPIVNVLHNFFHSIGFELGFHYLCHRYGGVSDQLRIGCDVSQDVLVILVLVQTAPSDRRARSFHHV